MLEAYEIGISLALQDGVSAGIASIRRDLDTLDRAIAATSQNLARLQTQAGSAAAVHAPAPVRTPSIQSTESPALPKPAQAAITKPVRPLPEPSLARPVPPAQATRQYTTSAPARVPEPQEAAVPPAAAGLAFPAVAAPPPARPLPQPVLSSAVASAPVPPAPARPIPLMERPTLPAASAALAAPLPIAAPTRGRDPPTRSVAPPAPLHSFPSSTPGSPAAPPPSTGPSSAPRGPASIARQAEFQRQEARPAMPRPAVPPASPAYRPPSPGAPVQTAGPRPSRAVSVPSTPSAPSVPRSAAPAFAPSAAPPTGQQGSFAPPPPAPAPITMQGDIVLDGARVGRWMASNLARQAARPPAGPTGPDPRQTPLWSGQAQGF